MTLGISSNYAAGVQGAGTNITGGSGISSILPHPGRDNKQFPAANEEIKNLTQIFLELLKESYEKIQESAKEFAKEHGLPTLESGKIDEKALQKEVLEKILKGTVSSDNLYGNSAVSTDNLYG